MLKIVFVQELIVYYDISKGSEYNVYYDDSNDSVGFCFNGGDD